MAHELIEREVPLRRMDTVPPRLLPVALALVVIGAVAFVTALLVDADRAWRAYQYNWLYFTTLSAGAVMLSVVVSITKGLWSRPMRRFSLSFVAFLPVAFVLLIPLFFGAEHIFPWLHEELHGPKEIYLSLPFLIIRNLLLFGLFVAGALTFAYWALRPDVGALHATAPGHLRGVYGRFSNRWLGDADEAARSSRKLAVLGPAMVILFALAFTSLAVDFVMSLEPHFISTLLPAYIFMAGFLGGVAATGLMARAYHAPLDLEGLIDPTQFHDIGKLTFAFCVFWAYLFWSQYIVIWYGLLPQEQIFVIHRISQPFTGLAVLVFCCLFVFPFFTLLGVAPKRVSAIYGTIAALILFGLWIERYLLIYPSHYPAAATLPFGWQEVGVGLFFAGLLILSLVWFAQRFPMLQRWQPLAEVELMGVPAPGPPATGD